MMQRSGLERHEESNAMAMRRIPVSICPNL